MFKRGIGEVEKWLSYFSTRADFRGTLFSKECFEAHGNL
jgi:hypothetical protein